MNTQYGGVFTLKKWSMEQQL